MFLLYALFDAICGVVNNKHNAIYGIKGVNASAMAMWSKKPAKMLENLYVGAYSRH